MLWARREQPTIGSAAALHLAPVVPRWVRLWPARQQNRSMPGASHRISRVAAELTGASPAAAAAAVAPGPPPPAEIAAQMRRCIDVSDKAGTAGDGPCECS